MTDLPPRRERQFTVTTTSVVNRHRIGAVRALLGGRRMTRHTRTRRLAVALLLNSLLLAGCGASATDADSPDANVSADAADTATTTGPAAAAAFTTWRADHFRASCERKLRCVTPSPFPSVDDCVAAADEDLVAATPRIADSIARGDTKFFPEEAAACIAIYATACTTSMTDILIACNKAYDGQQQEGESCVGHFECGGPSGPDRLLCWDGCTSLFGYEDVLGSGHCVHGRPASCPL
jgi:hypothetical protein